MSKKAILFDLDGTLTDSGEGIMNAAALVLRHFDIEVPTREQLRVFVGPPLADTFVKFGIAPADTAEGIEVFREYYMEKGIYENFPYPGIRELLESLKSAGHSLYVATSKPEYMAVQVLEHFDLAQYFDLICGATPDESRVEKSQIIDYLLTQTGDIDSVVMVGDTTFDILGAAAHGISAIGVAWGYGAVQDLQRAGAAAIAHTPGELLELLQKEGTPVVYHVSPTSGLTVLKPHLSSHGREYVYAVENLIPGLLFGASHDDFDFLVCQNEEGITSLYECYPGALQRVYQGHQCSVYELPDVGFQRGMTTWSAELVCKSEVPVLAETVVSDLYAYLLEAAQEGKLSLHRYSDAPEYKKRISEHIVDRLIRFDALDHLETDPRFQRYYRGLIEALRNIMDGHLL